MTSFPTGVLRFAGFWVGTQQYTYGMYVIASDNKSYGCGAVSNTGTNPTVQPSVVWFPFPNPGGGGGNPGSWSEYAATQNINTDSNQIISGGIHSTFITLDGDITLDASAGAGRINLNPSELGGVIIGGGPDSSNESSALAVNYIQNVNGVSGYGTAGQILSQDGTQILWVDPIQVRGQVLSRPVTVSLVGVTVLSQQIEPTIQSQAFVTVTMNYEALAPGADFLTVTLKTDLGSGTSIVIDDAVLTSVSLGGKQSCALSGIIGTLLPNADVNISLIAESSGEGAFRVNTANMSVMYNIVAQP